MDAENDERAKEMIKPCSASLRLIAEGRKYQRETLLYPLIVGAALFGAGAGFMTLINQFCAA